MVDATCDLTAPGSRLWPCPPSENSMTQVGGAGPFWQKVSGLRSRHPCCVCGRGGGCARSRGHRLPCLAQRAASRGNKDGAAMRGRKGVLEVWGGQGVGGHKLLPGSACRMGSQEQLGLGDGGRT